MCVIFLKWEETNRSRGMKSWKTTVSGAAVALGEFLQTQTEPEWLPLVGKVVVIAAVFFLGASARDNNKSSETVGAQ
ncbi:hypothetical protein [Rubritalea halochordaticola]